MKKQNPQRPNGEGNPFRFIDSVMENAKEQAKSLTENCRGNARAKYKKTQDVREQIKVNKEYASTLKEERRTAFAPLKKEIKDEYERRHMLGKQAEVDSERTAKVAVTWSKEVAKEEKRLRKEVPNWKVKEKNGRTSPQEYGKMQKHGKNVPRKTVGLGRVNGRVRRN